MKQLQITSHEFNILFCVSVSIDTCTCLIVTLVNIIYFYFIKKKNGCTTGFKDAKRACCDLIPLSEGGNGVSCRKGGNVCGDRNAYVYFDGLHPTEAVNVHIANKAFSSYLKNEVYPINVSQLAKLQNIVIVLSIWLLIFSRILKLEA